MEWADYLAAQRRRAAWFATSVGAGVVDEPGIVGWAASASDAPTGRLFVHDEAEPDLLTGLLDRRAPLEVCVLGEARGDCIDLLDRRPEFVPADPATAMLLPLPADVPVPPLDPALTAQPVGRTVSLEDAAAACRRADPELTAGFDERSWLAHLQHIPGAQLLAAVDQSGAVVATAGVTVLGSDATVFFVSTYPAWRGRGLATAMTARALHAAAELGVTLVSLDASAAGRGSYLRLGFQEIGDLRSWKRQSVGSRA